MSNQILPYSSDNDIIVNNINNVNNILVERKKKKFKM